ncbi:sugar O-acetyltransferase [Megasphaera vaginalis (ex Bordigoni et al. 2020)]|uniref:sugar O-acetyltransferase n=1 Tax=Megasphaera vaginalis (ex Bordigoni et al. 2020) TaxID=2045301 RepID=UPI000C7A5F6F|nr:sugar O-acetyltransferase [Megasphaera vaginalis (ex Bordigoni et al. 2020)]
MTERERMEAGKLYVPQGEELRRLYDRAKKLTGVINNPLEHDEERRKANFRELFGAIGERFWIAPPFYCDYGYTIHIGDGFAANYGCVIIDVAAVTIGNNVLLGPQVGIYTAGHPLAAAVRRRGLEFGRPVVIGDDVWIGGHSTVNPGVTIGSNVVIGSGSVVTRDIPDQVVAAGNPCRVLRPLTAADEAYWQQLADRYGADG